ncbi:MAG: bestrophin family ion channel [Vulcanimicrobiota bacterium]
MVVKPNQSYLAQLLSVKDTALGECGPRIAFATVIAAAVTWIEHRYGVGVLDLTPLPFSLIGVAIGIFLGFRGKTAYDRFWEGRVLWGGLVNNCRSATRQILTLLQAPPEEEAELRRVQQRAVYLLIAYAHALRHHLRASQPWDDLTPLVSAEDLEGFRSQKNVPLAILHKLATGLAGARARGWIHDLHLPAADNILSELTNIQGGCERIKNTPVPYAYGILSHRVVAAFCLCLPLGIVDDVKGYTPLVTAFVSYAFFSLDSLGAEIEEPFGTDPHDLPLSALCRTIEINLRQLLGETDLPEPWPVVDCIQT